MPVAGHEYSIILALASTWRPGGRRLSTAITTPDIRSVEDGHSSRKSRIGLKNSATIGANTSTCVDARTDIASLQEAMSRKGKPLSCLPCVLHGRSLDIFTHTSTL